MGRPRIARALAAVVTLALPAAVAAVAASPSGSKPRCFGAASLDREGRCVNPELRRMVVPSPSDALLMADGRPCAPVEAPFRACAFGTPPERATRIVALVGDSHAEHWRTPLYTVARRLGWSIIMITRGSCFFTEAVQDAPREKSEGCVRWNRSVQEWLDGRPEIGAIITSNHPGPVHRRPGETMTDAWVRGILGAWAKLPETVRHIIVIRDVPFIDRDTLPCVERALRRGQNAGRRCALPRRRAIHRDPLERAAARPHGRDARVIDMNDFICGPRRCFPVVGGALVFKDYFAHLTVTFGKTLGPYLLREVRRASASWGR